MISFIINIIGVILNLAVLIFAIKETPKNLRGFYGRIYFCFFVISVILAIGTLVLWLVY